MDEKILNILQNMQSQLTDMQSQMTDMQSKLAEHDRRFDHLEFKIEKEIKLLGDELHTEIQAVNDNVEGLREDFIALEVATAKNTFDIAKFKLVR